MNGILDPQVQGILSAAFNGLAASGPSRMPVGLGQIMGSAGQAGLQGYQQGIQSQRQGLLMDAQLAEMEKKKKQDEYLQQYASQLPASEKAAFLVDPAGYIKAKRETPFSKIDPEKFTPESVSAFMTGGGNNYSVLRPRVKMDAVEAADASGQPMTRFVDLYNPPSEGIPKPVKKEVTAGGIAYNPYSMAPQGAFQDPNKPFGFVSDGAGFKVAANAPYQQFAMDRAKAGASKVDVSMKQEGEESKKVGQYFGDQYAEIQKAGFSAQGRINRVNRMNELLDGVTTGKLTPAGTEAAGYLASLGLPVDKNLGNKQAAEALTNQMALELRNPAGGAGMPGAMSDSDRKFLVQMTPGLATSPDGRKLMNETAVKIARRDQDVAKLARKYREKNGQLNEGFFEELQKFSDANPLFPESSKPKFVVLGVEKP